MAGWHGSMYVPIIRNRELKKIHRKDKTSCRAFTMGEICCTRGTESSEEEKAECLMDERTFRAGDGRLIFSSTPYCVHALALPLSGQPCPSLSSLTPAICS